MYTGKPFTVIVNDEHVSGPQFNGSVREWYETLVETIHSVTNEVSSLSDERLDTFVSLDVYTILCACMLFQPDLELDFTNDIKTSTTPIKVGMMLGSNVYYAPDQPRNIVRVGHLGGDWIVGEVEILDMNII